MVKVLHNGLNRLPGAEFLLKRHRGMCRACGGQTRKTDGAVANVFQHMAQKILLGLGTVKKYMRDFIVRLEECLKIVGNLRITLNHRIQAALPPA